MNILIKEFNKIKEFYKLGKDVQLKDALVLLKACKSFDYKKGELLLKQGTKENNIYFITKGLVRCFNINEKGEEVTFQLIKEYQLVGNIHFILFDEPSKFSYEAIENLKGYSISYDNLQKILSNNPKLETNRKFFFRKILKQAFGRLDSFVLLSPEERYKKYIKDFPGIINRAPDKHIANVLGITPVSLSRIRKRIASKK
jgi:CRP-like cAMP-binding protein